MAAYQAKISLIVEGEQKIKSLQDRISNLSKQITELKRLDIGGVFEDPVTSGAVSHLRKVRQKVHQDEAKATDGIIRGQRLLNNSTEQRLLQQIKLNAAVDLYSARVKALSRTGAGDQKQFQTRVEDIQKAFEFFKGKGSVRGVQAAATELGRIVEYSREVTRLETGRINSQEKLKGYGAEIAKYNKLGLDTSKAQATFDNYKVKAGTNQYVLADKYNSLLVKRLGVLKGESKERARIAQQQFGASSPVRGAANLIGSPINKQMGTQAAVALQAFKLKTTQAETKTEVAAVQDLQRQKTKALQDGTKTEVAAVQDLQRQKTKALQDGTKTEVAAVQDLQRQKTKALQDGTKTEVAAVQDLQRQKTKALQDGTKTEVAAVQDLQRQKTKALQDSTKAEVALAQQKQKTITTAGTKQEKLVNRADLLEQSLLQAKTKGLDVENAITRLQQVKNTLNRADLSTDINQLNVLERTLTNLQHQLKVEKAIAQTNKGSAKAPEDKKGAGGFFQQLSNPSSKLGSAVIGGGFPALMGGGPGAMIGGALGGAVGGFAGSIAASAIGQALDDFAAGAIEVSKSLASPIEGFEKLKEANLFASKSQEFYIQKLIETGRIAEATGAIQAQIIKKIGVSGYNDLTALGNASNDLSKAWADFSLQLQAAVAGPLAGLLMWLSEVVKLSTSSTQQQAERLDPAAFADAQMKAIGKSSTLGFAGNAAAYNKELDRLSSAIVNKNIAKIKPTKTTKLEDLNTIEAGIKAAEQQADIIKDAYRTGFRLQQQGIDLQRQGSDLQRRVAQEIYNKQQEILRLQVDNDRQRKQVAIEMVDLEYRRRISNEEGRVAAVLEAEAALMKTKAEGEANIESKKRLLELDIDKQKRETENYIFELGRTIDGIRRATLNHEMDVADYRLGIERKIGEQRRIEDAGQATGAVQTAGGKSGVTANSVAGFPITSRQVMRTHPVSGEQKMHAGTDIGTPMDTALAYSVGGVVTKATTMGGYGKILEVKLDNGVTAFAAHLNNTLVKAGERFTAKQLLARTGQTGVGTGPHLHMEGTKGGDSTAPLPYLVLDGKASKVAAAAKSSTAAQLKDASTQPIARPSVGTPDVGGIEATKIKLDKQDAQIRREALSIEQQLQNLREQAALDNVAAAGRGSKEIQQRKDALAYAKAELGIIGATSQDRQELLAFEAQSGVKVKIYQDVNDDILAKTKLQGKERKKLELALATGLEYTRQQIALDKEALAIAQQSRFEKEQAGIQAQLGVTGKGLQAGFIGQAGQAFESEMLKSGNAEQAQALATQTQALELATTKARALEGAYQDIGSAMASSLTDGVAGLIAGTTTAQQVFADFLKNVGDALVKAAQQMIAQYLAIATAKALAGLFSPAAGIGAGGTADGSAFGAKAFGTGGGGGLNIGSSGFPRAAGGPVSSNSTYMVGEKGPELFVPSAAGTIIPAGPTANIRDAMASGNGGNGATAPVLSMSFETTRFGNTDYVSRDQLEAAMMQTRAEATKAGARRGMTMTLDKLQQSPSTRSRVGLG